MLRFLFLAAIAVPAAGPSLAAGWSEVTAQPVYALLAAIAATLFGLLMATRPSDVSLRARITTAAAADRVGAVILSALAAVLLLLTLAPGIV